MANRKPAALGCWHSVSVKALRKDGELSHLRNVQQEPESQGPPRLSSSVPHPTKTCAGPRPSMRHPSIHPPVSPWRDPARPTDVSCRQVESSLTRAPLRAVQGPRRSLECCASSILVVDKVKRAGAVPSVSIMGRRCCTAVVFLWYSKGDAVSYIIREQRTWPGGEEVGPSCPKTHKLQPPPQVPHSALCSGGFSTWGSFPENLPKCDIGT